MGLLLTSFLTFLCLADPDWWSKGGVYLGLVANHRVRTALPDCVPPRFGWTVTRWYDLSDIPIVPMVSYARRWGSCDI